MTVLPHVDVGPFQVSSYLLVYAIAIVVGGMLAFRRLVRSGIGTRQATAVLTEAIAAAIVGSRAVFWLVLRALPMPEAGPRHIDGGSTEMGALLFGAAAIFAHCRFRRLQAGSVLDAMFGAVPLAQAIGRVGCFLGGCCYGKPTTLWLAMTLPGAGGRWEPRYPTQLLSSAADLATFFVLMCVERRHRGNVDSAFSRPGVLTALYFQLHFAARFGLEFMRDERPLLWAPLSWAHGAAAVGFLAAGAAMAWVLRGPAVAARPGHLGERR